MKKVLIIISVICTVVLISCEKDKIASELSESPTIAMKAGGIGDHGTSNFSDPTCQNTGSIDDCCPRPPLDCSREEVTVGGGLMAEINNVNDNSNDDVVDFFNNQDWESAFPQLIGETETLGAIANGDYYWNKRYYGDYVWVEFIGLIESDNFSLVVTE
jgi:hypothetical protein